MSEDSESKQCKCARSCWQVKMLSLAMPIVV